ncbi:hypothetical protein [Candidatus Nitrosocosmicus sp. FF01]|uniref:hypothetical protein n=1 Tax=Candidatus Nitrosocosmicus sp. FF01 TaxID=3397670 RepID=UPI0039EC3B5E
MVILIHVVCPLVIAAAHPSEILLTPLESSKAVGYDSDKLKLIPESSVLGVGCGNPIRFADIGEGDTVVDLGSGAGIDVFLAANLVKESGKSHWN